MKVQLLYADRSFDWDRPVTDPEEDVLADLELEKLLQVMAGGSKAGYQQCRQILLTSLQTADEIQYRQEILQDFFRTPSLLKDLENLLEALRERQENVHSVGILLEYPTSLVRMGVDKLEIDLWALEQLRTLCRSMGETACSRGLRAFAARAEQDLSDEFLTEAAAHLKRCGSRSGVTTAVRLGPGLKLQGFVPQEPEARSLAGLRRKLREPRYEFAIGDRDDAGLRALSELEERSLEGLGTVLMQTADHVGGFFDTLERELFWYRGCLRLRETLEQAGCAVCLPTAGPWQYADLRDGALALQKNGPVVGNSHRPGSRSCMVVTGANQGGKTTWLRSVGQAVLLGQAGAYAAASQLQHPIFRSVFTHFRREEDRNQKSGKLEEELVRMDRLVDVLAPGSLLLMNESFAATNETDGAEIGWQVMQALLDRGVTVCCVTHFYELARRFLEEPQRTLFLRAVRRPDGSRTFALEPGEPMPTGHGRDLYAQVFGETE